MHGSCMATTSTTITINADAYKLLKSLKHPGDSFSDVILENLQPPAETCGELLDRLESAPAPKIDADRLRMLEASRGRRSRRK